MLDFDAICALLRAHPTDWHYEGMRIRCSCGCPLCYVATVLGINLGGRTEFPPEAMLRRMLRDDCALVIGAADSLLHPKRAALAAACGV